jgi:site-specific recombinase XerD
MTDTRIEAVGNRALSGQVELAALPEETLWLANFTSAQTKATYRAALEAFVTFHGIRSLETLRMVGQAHVLAWRELLITEGRAARTVNNRISALSSMFKWLADKQLVPTNPAAGVRRPRVNSARVESVVLTTRQARTLLDAPDRHTLKGLRDAAYFHILLYTGCRISEARQLRVGDFFEDAGYWVLEFTIKGGKRHRVPVNQEIQIAIRQYLAHAGHGDTPESALLQPIKRSGKTQREGNRDLLTRRRLTAIFQDYAKRLGLPARATPHSTRATFATVGLEHGVPLQAMQEQLGHANINTTRMYYKREQVYRESAGFKVHY